MQSAVKLLSRSASYSGALRTCPACPFRSMRTHWPPHLTVRLGAVLERSLPYVTRATSRSLTISSNGRLLVTGVFCGTFLCSILSVIFVLKASDYVPSMLLPYPTYTLPLVQSTFILPCHPFPACTALPPSYVVHRGQHGCYVPAAAFVCAVPFLPHPSHFHPY